MKANWDIYDIEAMNEEQALRNLCRQLEQAYVDWSRPMTYQGRRLTQRFLHPQTHQHMLSLVTTKKRSITVVSVDGVTIGEVKAKPGMAVELYILAGQLLDASTLLTKNSSNNTL